MIEAFEEWVATCGQQLKDKGVAVDFVRRESPSPAAVATLESKTLVASITMWDIGACDVHILSYETGRPVLGQRYDVQSFDEILPVLEDVCRRMTAE